MTNTRLCFEMPISVQLFLLGYGLAAMVDILTGVMSGAHFATQVRKWTLTGSQDGAPNLGQVFIAVDPNCFAPDFEDRMAEMNGILRNLPPVRIVSPLFIVAPTHIQHNSLPLKVKL